MDLLRVGAHAALVYLVLLVLLRLAGKTVVRQSTPFDFVLALVIGDIVDDAVWSEVPIAQFLVAAATLVSMKLAMTLPRRHSFTSKARTEP